jgi:HKD family nuclease
MSPGVDVETHQDQLAAVRRVLDGADEALLGVAFVQQRGVNLLERQLATIGCGRLVATTAFGTTTTQGLQTATAGGLGVRVLNPSRGTFHPKLYVARHGDRIVAAIGSANLTGGLISNVEAVAVLSGEREVPALARLWELAESWWQHDDAIDWAPGRIPAAAEVLQPDLLAAIRATVAANPIIGTLASGNPNWVKDVTPDGVWVETTRSRTLGRPAQLVPAWMIQIAWEWLVAHGTLTNRHLLDKDGLNVKRSSFVCALLARLPGVEIVSVGRPIEIALTAVRQT